MDVIESLCYQRALKVFRVHLHSGCYGTVWFILLLRLAELLVVVQVATCESDVIFRLGIIFEQNPNKFDLNVLTNTT